MCGCDKNPESIFKQNDKNAFGINFLNFYI